MKRSAMRQRLLGLVWRSRIARCALHPGYSNKLSTSMLLGCARLRLPNETSRTQRICNLDLGAGLERQQRRPHRGVLQDPARDQPMLERDGAFHVRAAVIDGARDRQQLVMDRTRLRV